MMTHALLRVLFDPASYADAGRLPPAAASLLAGRAALNRRLMRDYALPARMLAPLDAHEQRVLDAWFDLRRAAFLLGGFRLRAQVLQQIGYLRLDPGLRRFIALPLPLPPVRAAEPLDDNVILRHGVAMLAPLFTPLSAAWRARAELLFPVDVASALSVPDDQPVNRTLIQLALFYAKNS